MVSGFAVGGCEAEPLTATNGILTDSYGPAGTGRNREHLA
jgi:hypothetical protein